MRKSDKLRRGIIDRFEEKFVVIEFGDKLEAFPRSMLSYRGKEGDSVFVLDNEIKFDREGNERRKESIKDLIDELWED